jgi:DNA-directed RNA polymerase specialized sigma24 family protein
VAGDMAKTLDLISRSEVFDGFVRKLADRWPSLHETDVTALLWSEVVEAFYEAARRGEQFKKHAAWLWRVAWFKAIDLHKERSRAVSVGGMDVAAPVEPETVPWDDGEERRAERVRKAVQLAIQLLPRLGEANVQRVMRYIFEAYAAGKWEVTNEEIAQALGMTGETVRLWRSRGFNRLIREAKKERAVNPEFDLAQFEQEADQAAQEAAGNGDDE